MNHLLEDAFYVIPGFSIISVCGAAIGGGLLVRRICVTMKLWRNHDASERRFRIVESLLGRLMMITWWFVICELMIHASSLSLQACIKTTPLPILTACDLTAMALTGILNGITYTFCVLGECIQKASAHSS